MKKYLSIFMAVLMLLIQCSSVLVLAETEEDFRIVSQPEDYYGEVGGTACFHVTAEGEGLSYQWQYSVDDGAHWKKSVIAEAKTADEKVKVTEDKLDVYIYRCQIKNSDGQILYSDTAKLLSADVRITEQPQDFSGDIGDMAVFKVVAEGCNDLKYQWQYSANNGTTWLNSGMEGNKTPEASIEVTDTRIRRYIYRCKITTPKKKNYYTDTVRLRQEVLQITEQPVNFIGEIGETATFHVEVSGTTEPKYKWYYSTNKGETWHASGMAGADTADASIEISQKRIDKYVYRCRITNQAGMSVYTDTVCLKKAEFKITEQPEDFIGAYGDWATYHIAVVAGSNVTYQWQYSFNNGSTWHDSGMTGNKTPDAKIQMTTKRVGKYIYRCKVKNERGDVLLSDCVGMYLESQACAHKKTVEYPGVPATCTETGLTAGTYCKNCGAMIVSQEVIPTLSPSGDHEFGEFTEEVPATCEKTGTAGYYECIYCHQYFNESKEALETLLLPALGHHTIDVPGQAAGCIDGWSDYRKCDREGCDYKENYTVIPATGEHAYTESIVEPSGAARGYVLHTCSLCEETYTSGPYDYSLYEGVNFANHDKFLIPYNFTSNVYTLEASVNIPKTITQSGGVLIGNYNGGGEAINLEIYNGGLVRLYIRTGSKGYDYKFTPDVRGDGVKHLAVTVQRGAASLYIDGEFIETITLGNFDIPAPGRTMVLGGDCRAGNAYFFKGTIYSATVYRDIRTEEEIKNDIIISDPTDLNHCITYNLMKASDLGGGTEIVDPFESAQVTTAEELEYYAAIGTQNIEIMNDIVLDRTIYVIADVTIFSNGNYSITRAPGFGGDLFVAGEDAMGWNVLLDGIECKMTLGGGTGTLTIDGNKENTTVDVYGSLVYVTNSAYFTLNDGAVLSNNKKVANSRTLSLEQSHSTLAGGAAINNISGCVTINGGIISNNEVNTVCPAGEDSEAENYHLSTLGGAIFNAATLYIKGGTITGNSAYYGGAITNYLYCKITGGTFSLNSSSHAGGAIYLTNGQFAEIFIGEKDAPADTVVFENNASTDSSGGAIYSGQKCSTLIHGGVTFNSNSSKGSGGAVYFGGYGEIESNTVFTANTAGTNGGGIYVNYLHSTEYTRRQCTFNGLTMTGNTAGYGGAVACYGADAVFTNCVVTENTGSNRGGAFYIYYQTDGTPAVVLMDNVTISGNTSAEGGAIYADSECEVTITNSEINENTVSGNGGGISVHGAVLDIRGTEICKNSAEGGQGGGIYVSYRTINEVAHEGSVKLNGCFVNENTASMDGGAVRGFAVDHSKTLLTASNTEFNGNTAKGDGGVMALTAKSSLTSCTANGNTAEENGGAFYVASSDQMLLTDVSGSQNTAGSNGGFAYVTGGTFTLNNSGNAKAVVSGNQATGGGAIYGATNAKVSLTGVTFLENQVSGSGGALYAKSSKTFTVTDCVLDSNSATHGGALIQYGADVTISGTTFAKNTATGYGGAIYLRQGAEEDTPYPSKLTITDSEFSGNTGTGTNSYGGAIYVNTGTTLEVTGTTFTENAAAASGGAIYAQADTKVTGCEFNRNTSESNGGALGMYVAGNTLTLNNTTFNGNVAAASGGGLYVSKATVAGSGNTFIGNTAEGGYGGGGIYSTGGQITLATTIFSNNTADGGGAIAGYSQSTITLTDFEMTGNETTGSGAAVRSNKSVITLKKSANGTALISGNTANGGGGAIQIDAQASLIASDVTISENTANGSGGAIYALGGLTACTFTNCVISDNTATYGGAMIAYGGDVTFNGCTVSGNKANANSGLGGAFYIREDGNGAIFATVTAINTVFSGNTAGKGGAIYVKPNSDFIAEGCEFNENIATTDGGAIYMIGTSENRSALLLTDVDFNGNQAENCGAIYNDYCDITVSGGTFVGNTSEGDGGAMIIPSTSTLQAEGTVFKENAATASGGAIYAVKSITLAGCEFNGNTSGSHGGAVAIYNAGNVLTLTNTKFIGNVSTGNGGGFYVNKATVKGSGNIFTGNTGNLNGYGGGGFYSTGGTVTLTGTQFTDNYASNGGAFAAYSQSNITLTDFTMSGNTADKNGGAVFDSKSTVTLNKSVEGTALITGNTSTGGAALYADTQSNVSLTSIEMSGNTANSSGGAIYGVGGVTSFTATNCVISGNTANYGGAVIAYGANMVFNGCTVSGNQSLLGMGGAFYIRENGDATINATVTINNSLISANTSTGKGGAAYVKAGSTLNASKTTFTGNIATLEGGAIYSLGTVNLDECEFNENSGTTGGAAYFDAGSVQTVTDTTFNGNVATDSATYGGAIYVTGTSAKQAELLLTDVDFIGNHAAAGGAVYMAYADVTFDGGNVTGNYSTGNAGAFDVTNYSTMTVKKGVISGNHGGNGGVFYVNRSNLVIEKADQEAQILFGTLNASDAETAKNYGTNGGVIYATVSATVQIDGATFGYNNASKSGGAIDGSHATGAVISVKNSVFTGNSAASGGALYGELGSSITTEACSFNVNTSTSGGAVYIKGSANYDDLGSTFTGNTATNGGAVYLYNDAVNAITFENTVFDSNTVTTRGGAVYSSFDSETVYTNVTLRGNTAGGNGAGICATYTTIDNVTGSPVITINSLNIDQSEGAPVYIASAKVSGTVKTSGVIDLNHAGATVSGNLVQGTLTNIVFR